jgi:drug/metabolite transporter (DMT)-like permease
MTGAALLALLASASWGASDFLGGFASRRAPLTIVLAGSQLAGLLFFVPIFLAHGISPPSDSRLYFGLAAGVIAVAELGLIYYALRRGPVIVIAPIAALGAALPVIVGILGGDPVDLAIALGLLCAWAGSAAASWAPEDSSAGHEALVTAALAIAAAVGAGTILILIEASSKADAWWTIGLVRLGGIAVIIVLVAVYAVRGLRARVGSPSRWSLPLAAWGTIAAVGICDVGADTAYANATRGGSLSIVAVLASLYPVTTIALGAALLHERPARIQIAGAALACTGVVLLTAAS